MGTGLTVTANSEDTGLEYLQIQTFRLGVYDETHEALDQLRRALGERHVLGFDSQEGVEEGPTAMALARSEVGTALQLVHPTAVEADRVAQHSLGREILLTRCRHLLIVASSVQGLSITVGAIRSLLRDQAQTVTIVTRTNIDRMIDLGEPEEQAGIRALLSNGRLRIESEFDLKGFLARLGD